MIEVGEGVPDAAVWVMGAEGPEQVRSTDVLGRGVVVLFGVPGAFTPGCSKAHLPGFVEGADELAARGVDRIVCTGVNDIWVMDAWARDQGVGDKIVMMADGNGAFARAMGMEQDRSQSGFGMRSRRYAAVLEDGRITSLAVEDKPGVEASSCQAVLGRL